MPIYSPSKLSVYEDCPFKYKLSYIDRIKRETEGVEAFLGSRVHDTLKKCYDDLRLMKENSLGDLLAYYNKIWGENWHDAIVISKRELRQEHYRALGEKLIANYYRKHTPFDSDITVATEMQINFSLDDDNRYKLTGYIDRLSLTHDGIFHVHDYKTASHLPGQKEADNDRQLGLYHIGIQKKWPEVKDIQLVWHYLAFDTELVSHRTSKEISCLIESTKNLIDEIESTENFLPSESRLCNWCEYPDLCPKRKHLFKVETLPVNEYINEPGVVLVNKYASLKNQTNKLDEEIAKVKDAILDYSSREDVEVIEGNDFKVSISHDEKLRFPGKNDSEREELDALIKDSGKWDEVAELDASALTSVVKNGLWDKKLIEKIMKYGKIEENRIVRLSKLRDE